MKIKLILQSLFAFAYTRRTGTTRLLKKVASENDVWVLVPNEKMKKEFGASAITFEDLKNMNCMTPKPMLLDNYTIYMLSELALEGFDNLSSMIERRDKLIHIIRSEIERFDRENNHESKSYY